jgi:hypothetical protein
MLFVLCLSFVFIGCGGSGGGSSGGGGDAPAAETFNTVDFFPLTSSWQTDKWTLFVDLAQHDINGILTKALADTRGPFATYWTCDENGLILHGEMDEDGVMYLPSEPVVFIDSTCKIGDKKEGTYTMYGVPVNYVVKIVAKEAVSVPAGYFPNCLKIDVLVYPAGELPSQYGHETFWLAKGVGFVQGISDQNTLSELFTDSGQSRRLLSYHITPSDLSAEEQALREAYMNLNQYWKDGDMAEIATMIHPQYYDERCRNEDAVLSSWENFHNNNNLVADLMTPENIEINGDEAVMIREELFSFVPKAGGDIKWYWDRVLRKWKKDGGQWKYYGAHLAFKPEWLDVYSRHTVEPENPYLAIGVEMLRCDGAEITDPTEIVSSVTVTGPPGSNMQSLNMTIGDWFDSDKIFFKREDISKAVSGFYEFRLEEPDGDYFIFTDYLELTPPLDKPIPLSPTADESVPPGWVSLRFGPVAGAHAYRVDMQRWNAATETWDGMDSLYYDAPSFGVDLEADTTFRWRPRARYYDNYNRFDYYTGALDNESRNAWQVFTTDGSYYMGSYVQYRTYGDPTIDDMYRGYADFSRTDDQPVQEGDITSIVLKDANQNIIPFQELVWEAGEVYWGRWNPDPEPDGTYDWDPDTMKFYGFAVLFPEGTVINPGYYVYEATIDNKVISNARNFPEKLELIPVDDSTMSSSFDIDGNLLLSWANPDPNGPYNQIRVWMYSADAEGEFESIVLGLTLLREKGSGAVIEKSMVDKINTKFGPAKVGWYIEHRAQETATWNQYARSRSERKLIDDWPVP